MRRWWQVARWPAVAGLVVVGSLVTAQSPAVYFSPIAVTVTPDGGRALVAGGGEARLKIVELAAGKVAAEVTLPAPATDQCLSPDGKTLYVTCGEARGQVAVVDVAAAKVSRTIPVGHSPAAPALGADGNTLYLAQRFLDRLAVVDLRQGKITKTIAVVREPVALAIVPGAGRLLVANHLPLKPANGARVNAVLSLVDPVAGRQVATLELPNGSTGVRRLALSPDGRYAYVTHILARFQLPTTQLERGWMNTNAVTVVDLAQLAVLNTFLLDNVDHGAANPWGVACSPDGQYLYVAQAGTHEISVIDRGQLHERLARAAAGERVTEATSQAADVPNDLGFLVGLRQRVLLPGNSPRAVAATADGLVVGLYYSNSLVRVRQPAAERPECETIALGPEVPPTLERQGEIFFHDASLCFQQWQSCTSCHPDSRTDALNWDLLNDGIGNPKQTKNMLLAHATPPAMMSGVRESAEAAVRAGIRYIQFAVRPEADAQAIDAYLKSLRPVPSPHLVDGQLSAAAKRGRTVFAEARCDRCHSGPHFTDQQSHDVGTAVGLDEGKALDTPTLVEVWRTAPYLNDGRAVTLREVFREHNPGDRHGRTSPLTDQQVADLVAYVQSL